MESLAVTALLLLALVLPVVLFLVLWFRFRLNGLVAAAIAVATGWALNVAWALTNQSHADADTLSIAVQFGWACPTVLVLLTWLVRRIATRRVA